MLPMTPLISYLVRTYFDDEDGWAAILSLLEIPDAVEMLASVEPLSDRAFETMDLAAVLRVVPQQSWPLVVADKTTFDVPGFPVLIGSHYPMDPPFRVYVRDLSTVTSNLPIGNLGWGDFDIWDEHGVWDSYGYSGGSAQESEEEGPGSSAVDR